MTKLREFKEDKLVAESRWSYPDGSRKLYDRDKCPEGLDSDIWDCALYFEQTAESDGLAVEGRPILYTELAHRIHTIGIHGMYVNWVDAIKNMIDIYFDSPNDRYSINDFCSVTTFNYLLTTTDEDMNRVRLLSTGNRVVQAEIPKSKSKLTPEEARVIAIITRTYTEEELKSKLEEFRNRGK